MSLRFWKEVIQLVRCTDGKRSCSFPESNGNNSVLLSERTCAWTTKYAVLSDSIKVSRTPLHPGPSRASSSNYTPDRGHDPADPAPLWATCRLFHSTAASGRIRTLILVFFCVLTIPYTIYCSISPSKYSIHCCRVCTSFVLLVLDFCLYFDRCGLRC